AGVADVDTHEAVALDHEGGAVAIAAERLRDQVVAAARLGWLRVAQVAAPGLAHGLGAGAEPRRAEALETDRALCRAADAPRAGHLPGWCCRGCGRRLRGGGGLAGCSGRCGVDGGRG